MIPHLIFSIYGLPEQMTPEGYFKSIGLAYEVAEPNSYQECWHLFGVAGAPDPLPPYFTLGTQPYVSKTLGETE